MRSRIEELIGQLFPGARVDRVRHFGTDVDDDTDETAKGIGYGKPIRIGVRLADGSHRDVVLHTATGDDFGHDRRADRAAEMILAYDTFGRLPRHVAPIDVGFVAPDGALRSIRDGGECYLVTAFAPGTIYAHDLRELAHGRALTDRDRLRTDTLADYLAALHREPEGRPALYTRAIRDLVGHGEGIFGLVDGYPDDVPSAPPERLHRIELACAEWRWHLRDKKHRLRVTHGDFHPFNLLFDDDDRLSLLDAARGCVGDPADDACCIALNYVFFAVGHDGAWRGKLGALWHRFWDRYLERTGDRELYEVAPPFIAWRALVMANPQWYPNLDPDSRDLLLTLVEQTLARGRFSPDSVEVLFP